MNRAETENPFDVFFENPIYLDYKNHLYNYLLRRNALRKELAGLPETGILEVGSGVSPIAGPGGTLYSDISESAMRLMRSAREGRETVVASVTDMPFAAAVFQTVVCSEVLEHIPDDEKAIREMSRVLKTGGALLLTVPLHKKFYGADDKFVGHFRRYEVAELEAVLARHGFEITGTRKLMGLLEKATMLFSVAVYRMIHRLSARQPHSGSKRVAFLRFLLPLYQAANLLFQHLVRAEAFAAPRCAVTVLLLRCRKRGAP